MSALGLTGKDVSTSSKQSISRGMTPSDSLHCLQGAFMNMSTCILTVACLSNCRHVQAKGDGECGTNIYSIWPVPACW